jgi:hypothetical protein
MNQLADHIQEAKDYIERISSKFEIESVILDDWGNAYRLIYGLSNSDKDVQIELEVDIQLPTNSGAVSIC